MSERTWRWVDDHPAHEPVHGRTPDRVEHVADFDAMTYTRTASFTNDEWAESDTSRASEHYQIEREAAEWRIRLVGRNSSTFTEPHAWEPAPAVFATAWNATRY